MAGIIIIATAVVFITGMICGAVLLVSLASLKEDGRSLPYRAPGLVARAGRMVTGLKVIDPDRPYARPDRSRKTERTSDPL